MWYEELQRDDKKLIYGVPLKNRLKNIIPTWINVAEYHGFDMVKGLVIFVVIFGIMAVFAYLIEGVVDIRWDIVIGIVVSGLMLLIVIDVLITLIPDRIVFDFEAQEIKVQKYGYFQQFDMRTLQQINIHNRTITFEFADEKSYNLWEMTAEMQDIMVNELANYFPDVPMNKVTKDEESDTT